MEQLLGSGYLLHESIGRGAMGQVFAGRTRSSGVPVAIKVLKPELVNDPAVVARFLQERAILTSISDPHVVQVIDLVAEGETLAIVMELVPGPDLRRYLRQRRTLRPAEAVNLTAQLLDGIAAVHAAGIVHRDIKPENLLLAQSGGQAHLKVSDFGVSRLSYGASLTRMTGLIGTPEYMAPELAEHESASQAADLYSAGIVLYELLCGRTPFSGGHPVAVLRRHLDEDPAVIPAIPAELWDQIACLLAKDPDARPSSARQAAASLAGLGPALAGLPPLEPAVAAQAAAVTDSQPHSAGATILRHRDRGTAAGGAAPGPGEGRPGPGPAEAARGLASAENHLSRRTRAAVLCGAALVLVAVTVAGIVLARHDPVSVRMTGARARTTHDMSSRHSPAGLPPAGSPSRTGGPAATNPVTPVSLPAAGIGAPPAGSATTPAANVTTPTGSAATPAGNAPGPGGGTPAPAAVTTAPAPSPPAAVTAVAIPLGDACKWAYPGQAVGSTSGSGDSVVCLDAGGQSLGGFPDGSGHSLNDWCADPSHTEGNPDLIQAKLTSGGWVCTTVG